MGRDLLGKFSHRTYIGGCVGGGEIYLGSSYTGAILGDVREAETYLESS